MNRCQSVLVFALTLSLSSLVWADEKSHREAAEDFLKTMDVEKTMESAMDVMLAAQLKANPQLAAIKPVMKKFLEKHISYKAVKDELIDIYVEELTEAELKEAAAFYRTPTGKKLVNKLPTLMQRGAELGQRRVLENAAELQQMIQDELKKK